MNWILIAIGGAIGSVLRFGVQSLIQTAFPWGTMVVNIFGCLVIGFVYGLTERFEISPAVRMFVMIGILGGFTTFSSFALETRHLLADKQWLFAVGNVLLSNVVGIAMVFVGTIASRAISAR